MIPVPHRVTDRHDETADTVTLTLQPVMRALAVPRRASSPWCSLLDRVPAGLFAAHLRDRFEHRAGPHAADLTELAMRGGRPHHNFHVFAVYPWVGLLRAGQAEEPMRVLDACRIGWGPGTRLHDGLAEVDSRPLAWDGRRLYLGPARPRLATVAMAARAGDTVSLHWD